MFYTVAIETEIGQGDYGTDQQAIVEDNMSTATLAHTVRELEHAGHHVLVFRGKGLGILQYETEQAGR